MRVNNCNELEFATHLAKAQLDFEDRNKIYRLKMIADLDRFGRKGIKIKENYLPIINNPYTQEELEKLKNECSLTPRILDILIDNYEGTITIECDKTNKIIWFDDNQTPLQTKFNFGEKLVTKFSVKDLHCSNIIFKLIGEYGVKISKKFYLQN